MIPPHSTKGTLSGTEWNGVERSDLRRSTSFHLRSTHSTIPLHLGGLEDPREVECHLQLRSGEAGVYWPIMNHHPRIYTGETIMRKLVAIVLLGLSLSACGTSGPSDAEVYTQAVAPMNDATLALAQAMTRGDLPEVRAMADRAAEEASIFLDVLNNTNWSGDAARHARELSDLIAYEIILLRSLAKSDDENIAFAAEDFATVYQESSGVALQLRRSLGFPDAPAREVTS